jgi:ADP-ribosylglycohydrolase
MALDNLKSGKMPPHSGHDNPHYFDDMAMIRSLSAALIFREKHELVLEKTRKDAEVTHSEDGIHCALALATVATSLLADEAVDAVVAKALKQLPDGSWSQRVVNDALAATASAKSVTEVAYILEDVVIDRIYSYSISAPESLALILCYLRVAKSSNDFLLAGTIHKRKLDSMPALLGAIAGLIHGDEWIPAGFIANGSDLDGVCIPSLKGKSLTGLVEKIIG